MSWGSYKHFKLVPSYRGIPILVTAYLENGAGVGSFEASTTVYCVNLSRNGLHAITPSGSADFFRYSVEDAGNDLTNHIIRCDYALAGASGDCAAKLVGVGVPATVAAITPPYVQNATAP
jgi:hypothetical protein